VRGVVKADGSSVKTQSPITSKTKSGDLQQQGVGDPKSLHNRSFVFGASVRNLTAGLRRTPSSTSFQGSGKSLEVDVQAEAKDSDFTIVFRDLHTASEALREIRNVIKMKTLPMDIGKTDVHPMAVLFGLVDYDSATGNLQETIPEQEATWLNEFLDELQPTTWQKNQIIADLGSLNRAIYCVVLGSVSARNKLGTILVRRGSGEVFGEWSSKSLIR